MGLALGFRSVVVRISTLASLRLGVRMVRRDLCKALVTKCLNSDPGLSCSVYSCEHRMWLLGKVAFLPLNVPIYMELSLKGGVPCDFNSDIVTLGFL